jgi:3-methyladenine DNA glycosylase AlkD
MQDGRMATTASVVRSMAAQVRTELAAAGNPAKAAPMQAYMKSAMPYYGVQSADVRRIARAAFDAWPLADRSAWEEAVRTLWHDASHREERYVAIALTGHRPYATYQDPTAVALYEELIVTGAWWDYVDEVAVRRIGPILGRHPAAMTPVVRAWAVHDDLWLRRSAVICQTKAKSGTDVALLEASLAPNLDRREFWIRKAVGWALREHAKTDPGWVRDYVAGHDDQLSGLSRREALKHVSAAPSR